MGRGGRRALSPRSWRPDLSSVLPQSRAARAGSSCSRGRAASAGLAATSARSQLPRGCPPSRSPGRGAAGIPPHSPRAGSPAAARRPPSPRRVLKPAAPRCPGPECLGAGCPSPGCPSPGGLPLWSPARVDAPHLPNPARAPQVLALFLVSVSSNPPSGGVGRAGGQPGAEGARGRALPGTPRPARGHGASPSRRGCPRAAPSTRAPCARGQDPPAALDSAGIPGPPRGWGGGPPALPGGEGVPWRGVPARGVLGRVFNLLSPFPVTQLFLVSGST
ncbi:basic proline-rich protein-like [Perognathus longimembris pacificus]|uniref:basic proline-rich protein-like n=1 Tax=Perognathus longimembris pacificus TaxID=214514 RepID=UPI002018E5CC|nr:basic proline-rich protein-like [Perognathus longimembris pacificus]